MQFSRYISLISLLVPALAQDVAVSCEQLPFASLESTPYSVSTTAIIANGKAMQGVFEYYRSITYVSSCGFAATTTTKHSPINTQYVF
uniref:A-agglutinin adhesion subunit n=1 Tax=Saccharomyces bayanus TaxID=4931 RepID=Q8J1R7_SACBA|nr:a-agglutinin adhesion subunit [Saccharomyces bayanus]